MRVDSRALEYGVEVFGLEYHVPWMCYSTTILTNIVYTDFCFFFVGLLNGYCFDLLMISF